MRELSLFILLISPATNVLTTMLFQYNEKGWNQYANAINLLIVGVVLLSRSPRALFRGIYEDRGKIAIGMVGISYGKYLRWSWKLFVMEFGLAALAMLGAVAIGY